MKPLEASDIDEALLPGAGFLIGENLCEVPIIFDYATSELSQDGDWWGSWSRRFAEIAASEGLKTSAFRRRRRHKGELVAEGTVGAVSLDGLNGNADDVLQRLRRLHWKFLESVGLTDAERSAARMT